MYACVRVSCVSDVKARPSQELLRYTVQQYVRAYRMLKALRHVAEGLEGVEVPTSFLRPLSLLFPSLNLPPPLPTFT